MYVILLLIIVCENLTLMICNREHTFNIFPSRILGDRSSWTRQGVQWLYYTSFSTPYRSVKRSNRGLPSLVFVVFTFSQ